MADSSADIETRRRLARSVLTRNVGLHPGENIVIEGWTKTLPWAVALAREARRMKAHPLILYEDEEAYWDSVEAKEDRILGANATHEWAALGKTDVYVHMWGPGDRARLASLPEARRDRLMGFNEKWYDAARKAKLRGARLEIGRVHPSLAKLYGVDEGEWAAQVLAATLVDPAMLHRTAAPIVKALERGKSVRIHDDHGTDLRLALAGRKVRATFGAPTAADRATRYGMLVNVPAGLVRVALDEGTAEGTLVANRSGYYDEGRHTGARFSFAGGRLTDASFESGGELFEKPYRAAGKGRDQPGILSIGLNPGLHDTPQLEDVEQGAVLVSVGSNDFLGGKNKAGHFGFAINAGAIVEVDGRELPIPRAR